MMADASPIVSRPGSDAHADIDSAPVELAPRGRPFEIYLSDNNLIPSLAHPRLCMNGSPSQVKQCLAMVKSWTEQLHRLAHHRRELQNSNHNPNLGDIKVLVLLVQFSDHGGRNLTSKSVIEELWNGDIKEWFNVNSQGRYTVDPYVVDWKMTDNSETFYANGRSGFSPETVKAMWPILDELDNQQGWDWSQFDSDQDGKLDSVVMMHSSVNAVGGGDDCFGRGHLDRIWPHAYTGSSGDNVWRSKDESYRIGGYTMTSVYDQDCDTIPTTAGLPCHEYMHTMALVVSVISYVGRLLLHFRPSHIFRFDYQRICTMEKTCRQREVSNCALKTWTKKL
jgi:Immune inhibitor A peptidase M6